MGRARGRRGGGGGGEWPGGPLSYEKENWRMNYFLPFSMRIQSLIMDSCHFGNLVLVF